MLLVLAAIAAIAVAGVMAASAVTDKAAFCGSCHEMKPYNDAWASGPHKGVQCVECHVDPGTGARVAHKLTALREVRDHFLSSAKFSAGGVDVPDSRCLVCHTSIPDKVSATGSRFSHSDHAKQGACWKCHTDTGHLVATETAAALGVVAPANRGVLASVLNRGEARGAGGHVPTTCSRCHDLARMDCSGCHSAEHKRPGACTLCHAVGAKWVFEHPKSGDCAPCHTAKHEPKGDCRTCHEYGPKWVFRHPTSEDCASCHKPKHGPKGDCKVCHKVGGNWAFAHPASADCASCHKPPASHYGADCTKCHSTKTPFASATFSHPATVHGYRSRPCASCHPKSYSVASCTCHGGGTPGD